MSLYSLGTIDASTSFSFGRYACIIIKRVDDDFSVLLIWWWRSEQCFFFWKRLLLDFNPVEAVLLWSSCREKKIPFLIQTIQYTPERLGLFCFTIKLLMRKTLYTACASVAAAKQISRFSWFFYFFFFFTRVFDKIVVSAVHPPPLWKYPWSVFCYHGRGGYTRKNRCTIFLFVFRTKKLTVHRAPPLIRWWCWY